MNMLKEDLEKAVLYSNICLKKWSIHKAHLVNGESVRSMINGWLVRVIGRNTYSSRQSRKTLSKGISRNLFVTIHEMDYYITSISIQGMVLPQLDYIDLHQQAAKLISESTLPHEIQELNLKSIETIKFN